MLSIPHESNLKRAVFLDRDGVINHAVVRNGKAYPPANLEAFKIILGVESTIHALRKAGFLVIVVTNQPDVATGVQQREVVEAMHDRLRVLDLCDDIMTCYHVDADACDCRKPKPGMLIKAACEWQIDLKLSFMVGDSWRDVAAGKATGCYTFFVDYQYQEQCTVCPDMVVGSLQEAGKLILLETYPRDGGCFND